MGQQAFKAATSRLSRAGANSAAATGSGRTAAAAAGREASASESQSPATSKQVPRTHPSNTAGFQRGEAGHRDVRDAQQHEFLQKRAGGASGPTEMPDDLVQFLRSAGPLQKREAKPPPTSSTTKGGGAESQQTNQPLSAAEAEPPAAAVPKRRRREMMPLAANVEGFGTERTTNFSYDAAPSAADDARAEEEDGVFDVLDLYRLLVSGSDGHELARVQDADLKQRILDTQRYLEVPVVVKESEEDGYIGVHKQTLETLSVPPVPKTIVKLVLEDMVDTSRSISDQKATSH